MINILFENHTLINDKLMIFKQICRNNQDSSW